MTVSLFDGILLLGQILNERFLGNHTECVTCTHTGKQNCVVCCYLTVFRLVSLLGCKTESA